MSRVWIFRETGEVRKAENNEWYMQGDLISKCGRIRTMDKHTILTLETIDHDPMEPIVEGSKCP